MRTILRAAIASALVALLAVPGSASAHGPMVQIDLACPGGAVQVEANPVYLWIPGHVESGADGAATHIVTGIFGFNKGSTNEKLPFGTVECTVVGGPLDGLSVWGFFVPRKGP